MNRCGYIFGRYRSIEIASPILNLNLVLNFDLESFGVDKTTNKPAKNAQRLKSTHNISALPGTMRCTVPSSRSVSTSSKTIPVSRLTNTEQLSLGL